ncbi:mRNA cap guanine-N7 methyltransferase-like isoform X2 [Prorops nasuta]
MPEPPEKKSESFEEKGEVEKKEHPSKSVEDTSNHNPRKRKLSSEEKEDWPINTSEPKNKTFREEEACSSVPSDLSTGNKTEVNTEKIEDNTSLVAEHYNALKEEGLDQRNKSRIVYMRNFNNWIKSMLIGEYVRKVRQNIPHGSPFLVLDMCCGKGGDLNKWLKGNITHLVCADIADISVEQCEQRYKDIAKRNSNNRGFLPVFKAEFIAADCTKVRLRTKYKDPSIQFDLVSCQFAFHYSFESLPQAECMLQNASETLKPGGYFIGTVLDAYDLVSRWQQSDSNKFGNDVYNIEFLCDKEKPPLFGAKYNFHLEGVVDCPEFLVHLPTLVKLAEKFNLKLVKFERFEDFYKNQKDEGRNLLGKIQVFETFPPYYESPLLGQRNDYRHAEQYMQNTNGHRKIGTLSQSEWDVISLYSVFAFQKVVAQ